MSRATDAIMAARIGPCTITLRSTTPWWKTWQTRWDCLYHAHPGSLPPLARISGSGLTEAQACIGDVYRLGRR